MNNFYLIDKNTVYWGDMAYYMMGTKWRYVKILWTVMEKNRAVSSKEAEVIIINKINKMIFIIAKAGKNSWLERKRI